MPVRKVSRCLAAGMLVLLGAAPARAEVVTYGKAGLWDAFAGTSSDQKPMCGISTSFPDRMVLLKWFAGRDHLTFHLTKVGWNIPGSAEAPMSLKFDTTDTVWTVTGKSITDAPHMLELYVPNSKMRDFARAFTSGNLMVVNFLSGSEPPWYVQLTGNAAMWGKLAECVLKFGPSDATNPFAYARPQTQPFAPQPYATTQPFAAPSVTQPFQPPLAADPQPGRPTMKP